MQKSYSLERQYKSYRHLFFIAYILCVSTHSWAASEIESKDVVGIASCDASIGQCYDAIDKMRQYISIGRATDLTTLSLFVRSNSSRIYDQDARIMTYDRLKSYIQTRLRPEVKTIEIIGAWTATPAIHGQPSIVQRLSQDFKDYQVTGMDGFVWIKPDGTLYTTHQAYTVFTQQTYPYKVSAQQDIMLSFIDGVALRYRNDPTLQELDIKELSLILLHIGMAEDTFLLNTPAALATYLKSAELGNVIAMYNAAYLLLKQNKLTESQQLLERAIELGDTESKSLLEEVKARL